MAEIEKTRLALQSEFGVRVFYHGADMRKPDDIRAMVDAIRALDTDAGLRSRLSELGPRQASLFSPERYQVRVRDAYAKLGVRLGD